MENLKNIISPLSAEDIKCKQTLEETQKKLAETRKALEEVNEFLSDLIIIGETKSPTN